MKCRATDRRNFIGGNETVTLDELGFDSHFQKQAAAITGSGIRPARVIRQAHQNYELHDGEGVFYAVLKGSFRHETIHREDFPAVGNWVMAAKTPEMDKGLIHLMLQRRTAFTRKTAGSESAGQVIAANIDTAFITAGLDSEFNLRRLERYLALCTGSGVDPVIILNKRDLRDDLDDVFRQIGAIAMDTPVFAVSAKTGENMERLGAYCRPGATIALLGSSGVGKSSIINALTGSSSLRTTEVRQADSRGRHTTTQGQLIFMPGGALLVDTPGLREIQLPAEASAVSDAFEDIHALAEDCRFRDCTHSGEPGCAVKAAIHENKLPPGRFENYLKLMREERYIAQRRAIGRENAEKARWKSIARLKRNKTTYK